MSVTPEYEQALQYARFRCREELALATLHLGAEVTSVAYRNKLTVLDLSKATGLTPAAINWFLQGKPTDTLSAMIIARAVGYRVTFNLERIKND